MGKYQKASIPIIGLKTNNFQIIFKIFFVSILVLITSMSRRLAGIPDFISGDDMDEMISSGRLDPKVVFAYVQEVYRALKDN